jgi:hypothetical protein
MPDEANALCEVLVKGTNMRKMIGFAAECMTDPQAGAGIRHRP